jgi:hypothetical protein
VRINPANGAASFALQRGFLEGGNGLAMEPKSGRLLTAAAHEFVQLLPDPAGRVGTLGPAILDALAFHPLTGVLFGAQAGTPGSSLVTLDPGTGAFGNPAGGIRSDGQPLEVDAIAFQGPGGCSDAPLGPCTDAAKANLQLKAKTGRLKVALKKLGDTAKSEFGAPSEDTGYGVCIYESEEGGNPALVAGYTVPSGAAWLEKNKGFQFKDKEGAPDRINALRLSAGTGGRAQVAVAGKKGVDLPELPLASDTAVVQVVNDLGACFGAAVTAPAEENNTVARFKGIKPTGTPTPTATPAPTGTATPTPTATPTAPPSPSPTNGGIVILGD